MQTQNATNAGWPLAAICLLTFANLQTAAANGALRCGSNVVTQGDALDRVRHACGEPVSIVKSSILRRPSYVHHGRVVYFGDELVDVQVEKWTYNFGPQRLMHRLRFVDGVLEEIEVLGYGYHDSKDE